MTRLASGVSRSELEEVAYRAVRTRWLEHRTSPNFSAQSERRHIRCRPFTGFGRNGAFTVRKHPSSGTGLAKSWLTESGSGGFNR